MRSTAYIIAFLVYTTAAGQTTNSGPTFRHHEIQLNIGGWGSVIQTNLSSDPGGAAGSSVGFEYRYYHKSPFGIGVAFEGAKVNTSDQTDTTVKTAAGGFAKAGLSFRYNIISRPKFKFFVGTYHQVSSFEYKVTNVKDRTNALYCGGFQNALSSGINWYFSKMFGFFTDLRWHMQAVRGTKYMEDGIETDLVDYIPVDNVFLNFRGLDFRLGVSIHF